MNVHRRRAVVAQDAQERPGQCTGPTTAERRPALTITLALPARSLCGNGRAHGFARSRLVKAQRSAAAWVAREALIGAGWCDDTFRVGPAPAYFPTGRVRVDVLVRRDPVWSARRLDDGNLWHGLKAALDGLQDARVVKNDRQFTLGTITWERAPMLQGEVVLTIAAEEEA